MFSKRDINYIKRSKSKEYFEDVLQSYYSKNYRATILLLYNLAMDELYYKLILMNEERYYTNLADKINKIEELKNAEKYSEIEEKIYRTYKESKILNHDTLDMLEYLKKVRNKCAHPIYFEEDYSPLEEEVYMFIVKIYRDILIKETFIKNPYSILKPEIENERWGNIIEAMTGVRDMETDYESFKLYIISKYFEKFTEYNYKKLFVDLVKVIVMKNGEWEKLNQYRNMMLMKTLLEYLNQKGKMSILENNFEWRKIDEEQLADDENEKIYENEWYALTYLYDILSYNSFFIKELKEQNEFLYKKLKNEQSLKPQYLKKYWKLFYQDKEEMKKEISKLIEDEKIEKRNVNLMLGIINQG